VWDENKGALEGGDMRGWAEVVGSSSKAATVPIFISNISDIMQTEHDLVKGLWMSCYRAPQSEGTDHQSGLIF
jgi:hypothetical protein